MQPDGIGTEYRPPEDGNVTVGKAGAADIGALTALRLAYLREDHGSLGDAAGVIAGGLPAYFAAHLDRDLFCYAARSGEDIVSCAFLLVTEKPMSPAFLNGRTGTVLNVYTRPSCRGRGYAGRVMKALLADAQSMDLCTVELKATDAGRALYRSAGFTDNASKYHPMKWANPAQPRRKGGKSPDDLFGEVIDEELLHPEREDRPDSED